MKMCRVGPVSWHVRRSSGAACLLLVLISLTLQHRVLAAEPCSSGIARVFSIQGAVEIRRAQAADWQAAEREGVLCAGDQVRVGERGRAGIRLDSETLLRLDQRTTLTIHAVDQANVQVMDLIKGAIHTMTRTPRPFRVKTPFVNAGVEGTEFFVGVEAESARLAVYEGRVSASNDQGSLLLASGEYAVIGRNAMPRLDATVRPRDAVQWALYYPTIIDYRLDERISGTPGEAALRESIALYREGRVAEAIIRLDNVPEGPSNPRFLTYRAGLSLVVGRVDEARADLERALAIDGRNSDAYALQAVIAVVQDDKSQAITLATKAVELDKASPTARLALSYALTHWRKRLSGRSA